MGARQVDPAPQTPAERAAERIAHAAAVLEAARRDGNADRLARAQANLRAAIDASLAS